MRTRPYRVPSRARLPRARLERCAMNLSERASMAPVVSESMSGVTRGMGCRLLSDLGLFVI